MFWDNLNYSSYWAPLVPPSDGYILSWSAGTNLPEWKAAATGLIGFTDDLGNISFGPNALSGLSTAGGNIGLGINTGTLLETGMDNILIGARAGSTLVSGALNVIIGSDADGYSSSDNSSIVIGYYAMGKGNQQNVIGNTSTIGTWLHGNVLHIGNESNTDKYLLFQNSKSSTQPGFKWEHTGSKIQWSNDGSNWIDADNATKIQGYSITSSVPTDGYVLTWSASDGYYKTKQLAPRKFQFVAGIQSNSTTSPYTVGSVWFDAPNLVGFSSSTITLDAIITSNSITNTTTLKIIDVNGILGVVGAVIWTSNATSSVGSNHITADLAILRSATVSGALDMVLIGSAAGGLFSVLNSILSVQL